MWARASAFRSSNSVLRRTTSRLGGSLEQYKHPCLVPELDFATRILSLPAVRPTARDGAGRSTGEAAPREAVLSTRAAG